MPHYNVKKFFLIISSLAISCFQNLHADIENDSINVVDDDGIEHVFKQPVKRIVSLMPHATELLFEVGAGDHIVGAVKYSDFPEAAKAIPRVGGYSALNIEAIVALKPDLLIAWPEGNRNRELDRLKALGLPILVSDPREFKDIANALGVYGKITGKDKEAKVLWIASIKN